MFEAQRPFVPPVSTSKTFRMHDTLQFLCELPVYKEEQPYELYGFPEQQSEKRTNCIFEAKAVTVADVRNMNDAPQLEEHGFKFIQHISSCRPEASHFETVGGDKTIQLAYLEETIALVQHELKATKVICFDWRVLPHNQRSLSKEMLSFDAVQTL